MMKEQKLKENQKEHNSSEGKGPDGKLFKNRMLNRAKIIKTLKNIVIRLKDLRRVFNR